MADQPSPDLVRVIPSDRAWFDPRLLTAATRVQTTDVAVPMNVVTLLAKPNPSRLAILIVAAGGGFPTGNIAPWSDPNSFPMFTLGASLTSVRATLFEYPGLVQLGWYAQSGSAVNFRVCEVIRNG